MAPPVKLPKKKKSKKKPTNSNTMVWIFLAVVVVILSFYVQEIADVWTLHFVPFVSSSLMALNPLVSRWKVDQELSSRFEDVCEVDQIDVMDLTLELFAEEYFEKRPLLIRGGMETWPARTKWQKSNFLDAYGNETILIGRGPEVTLGGGVASSPILVADFVEYFSPTKFVCFSFSHLLPLLLPFMFFLTLHVLSYP